MSIIHYKQEKKDDSQNCMLNRANSKTEVPKVVVLRVDAATVEVQVPSVTRTVPRRGPVVAVRATVVAGRTIAVP